MVSTLWPNMGVGDKYWGLGCSSHLPAGPSSQNMASWRPRTHMGPDLVSSYWGCLGEHRAQRACPGP